MEYFIFDFDNAQHDVLIESYLFSAALSHKEVPKCKEWFLWKFRDNPFGATILACARDNNTIVGCVAIGLHNFDYESINIKGGISFETFVHPEYQGKGIFKKLINLAENESTNRGINFLLNFPNSNSLPGFTKMGWKQKNLIEYWIKPAKHFSLLTKLKELRKPFIPNINNFEDLNINLIGIVNSYKQDCSFYPVVDEKYLQWRFFKYPVGDYAVISSKDFFSIARVGQRGSLKEVQVLYVRSNKDIDFNLKRLLLEYKEKTKYDIVSFSLSKNNFIKNKLADSFFIKVPNKTNLTFKILNGSKDYDFDKIQLSAINYHTY